LRSDRNVAFIQIYAARHFRKTSRIFKDLHVLTDLSLLRSSSGCNFSDCSAYHRRLSVITDGTGAVSDVGASSLVGPMMEIRPRPWSFSRSSFVQTTLFCLSLPACGLLAARNGMAAETSAKQKKMHGWRVMFVTSWKGLEENS
jgi:hypothetical protein